jgi:hypothetical protein
MNEYGDEKKSERELTPMMRESYHRPSSRKNQNITKNEEDEEEPHKTIKKIGTSQIIKYLDLSIFKIEKCKNSAIGK